MIYHDGDQVYQLLASALTNTLSYVIKFKTIERLKIKWGCTFY